MRKNAHFLICTAAIACGGILATRGQDLRWEKTYGGRHAEHMFDMIATPDNGFIIGGSSLSGRSGNKSDSAIGNLDYLLWKLDEQGASEWQKTFGSSGADLLKSIGLTADGGFILGGTTHPPGWMKEVPKAGLGSDIAYRGFEDIWIIKLQANGETQWEQLLGGAGSDILSVVRQDRDGGYIVGGSSDSEKSTPDGLEKKPETWKDKNSVGSLDFWVIKLKPDGSVKWQKTFGGPYIDQLTALLQTSDGGYIAGGYSNSPSGQPETSDASNKSGYRKKSENIGDGDFWVIKIDKDGELEWEKTFGGEGEDLMSSLVETADGNYIASGTTRSGVSAAGAKSAPNGRGSDFWVLKFDKQGNRIWDMTYDFGPTDILTSLIENPDGTLLLGGDSKASAGARKREKGKDDFVLVKLKSDGEMLWSETVGSDGVDILKKAVEVRDGGYVLAGTSIREAAAKSSKSGKGKIGSQASDLLGGQSATGEALQREADALGNSVNEAWSDARESTATSVNDALAGQEGKLKLGAANEGMLLGTPSQTGGKGGGNNPLSGGKDQRGQLNKRPSGDMKKQYGKSDFWIVKVGDRNKVKEENVGISTFPNPTDGFTNIVIGYPYQSGTAVLSDLNGRVLQTTELTGHRTIPIDLAAYPEGIYIINVKTNVQADGIKVIKTHTSKK